MNAAIKRAYRTLQASIPSRGFRKAAHLVLSLMALLAAGGFLLRQPTIFSAQQSHSFLRTALFLLAVVIYSGYQTFL